jgi:predicted alpha-1,6-mannanase (GH76 family)
MVALRYGGLAARAAVFVSPGLIQRADQATYTTNSEAAINTLQSWYNTGTGLWDTTGWWNSGNCLTVLADFASINIAEANKLNIGGIMSNTFSNAQRSTLVASKSYSPKGLVQTNYTQPSAEQRRQLSAEGFGGFINDYYDDEGWWALGLLHSYDVNRDPGFLDMAMHIFEDMKAGTDGTCGGGIWWSKDKNYKNAIANELYLSVAASLANRATSATNTKAYYLDIAQKEWTWFRNSGMINAQNQINDGLNINSDGSCTNNGGNAWSYNQGVVLGGLVELAKATGDQSYITQAHTLAAAAISLLSDSNGIIHDKGCEPNCGGDGNQFKGIFVRNLGYLHKASPKDAYKTLILKNADSIWASDRNQASNQLGVVWSGPYSAGGGPTAATQSSALDVLVAAMRAA